MTQSRSLAKIKRFDLIQSFKQNWFIPVVLLGLMTYFYPIYTKIDYKNLIEMNEKAVESNTQSYLYYFFQQYSGMGQVITLVAFFTALLSAVIALSFFFSKKKSNVYLSTTLSRQQLFINRIIACCSMLFLAIFIPLTADLIWNITEFGFSSALFSVYLISVLGYTTFLLLGYGFGAIGAALAGNIAESIATASCLSMLPFGLLYFISRSMHQFLYGYIGHFSSSITYGIYDPSPLRFAYLTPTFFFMSVKDTQFGTTTVDKYSNALIDFSSSAKPGLDSYIPVIVWLVISLLTLAVAGRLLTKRKAENASSLGANTVANAIISCTLSIWAANIFLLIVEGNQSIITVYQSENILNIAIISIIALVVFFICQLILTRNIKRMLHSFKFMLPVLCAAIAVPVIMFTGGFGYAKYIPKLEHIESATVNIPYTIPFFKQDNANNGDIALLQKNAYTSISPIKAEKDLKNLISLQEELIKVDKENTKCIPIIVEYTMKDGTRISRCYTQTAETALTDVLTVADSDAVHNYLKLILTGTGDDSDYKLTDKEKDKIIFSSPLYNSLERRKLYRNEDYQAVLNNLDYENGSISLVSNDHQTTIVLREVLQKDEFQALKKNILDDLLSVPYKDLYMAADKPLAIITKNTTSEKDYFNYYLFYNLTIGPKMKNTVRFLEETGLLQQVTEKKTPIAAVVSSEFNSEKAMGFIEDAYIYRASYQGSYYEYFIPYFAEFNNTMQKADDADNALKNLYTIQWDTNNEFTSTLSKFFPNSASYNFLNSYGKIFKKEKLITDPEQLKALADAAYPSYYLKQGGYYVWMEYDKETTIMFIPKDKAPDFIK